MAETLFAPQAKTKAIQPRLVSLEAYFITEQKALHKHEYHDGIVIPMAGGTFNHDNLATKTTTLLNMFVFNNDYPYFVNGSETKIRIESYNKIVYPDALVVFEGPQYFKGREDTIVNPLIIVEVLSNSTKKFDKTTKFKMYKTLPTFKEYVLIEQDKKQATVFTKQDDGIWLSRDYVGDDAIIILETLHNCPVPLERLYRGLKLKNLK